MTHPGTTSQYERYESYSTRLNDAPGPLQEQAGVPAGIDGRDLVIALLERSQGLQENPAEAKRIARLAVIYANGLLPEVYTAAQLAEIQGIACAGYGRACRLAG